MRLHSPVFEKALRRKVRKTVRGSRELRREARAANRFRKQYHLMLLLRPAISVGFAIAVWRMLEQTGHAGSALALINLWAFVFVFVQAQRLVSCLYASSDVTALALLPVTAPTIFRWELQKALRGALWFMLDLLASYAAVALCSQLPAAKWPAVLLIAVVAWAEVLALAALCVAYLPRLPYQLASTGLFIGLFVLFMARDVVGNAVIALIDRAAPNLNLLLPTGWPTLLFQLLLPEGQWLFLLLLVPLGAALGTLQHSLRRLQTHYDLGETILQVAPDLVPAAETEQVSASGAGQDRPPRVGPTAIEEIIRSRQFLAAPAWHRSGWLEGLLWRWLSARERALADFVFPNGFSITGPWRKIFRNLAVSCLAALGAGFIGPLTQYWILGGGLFITFCQALAQVLATGRAFELVRCSGVNIPLYAGYAIGFRELARLLFKCSLVQFPALICFSAAASALAFYVLKQPIADGLLFGLKAGLLLLVSRFIFVACGFSSGTNDTSRVRLRSAVLLLFVVGSGLAFVALGGASLFVPKQAVAWLLFGLAALDAYIFFRGYGWFYHRNRFDLMSLPRQ